MPTNAEVCTFHITWLNMMNFFASIFAVPFIVSFSVLYVMNIVIMTSVLLSHFISTRIKKIKTFFFLLTRVLNVWLDVSMEAVFIQNVQTICNTNTIGQNPKKESKQFLVRKNMFQRYRFNWIIGLLFDFVSIWLCTWLIKLLFKYW